MKLTCIQMDVLLTFYIEGELSNALKSQVEDHLKLCSTCRAKYDIIKTMITDLKNSIEPDDNSFALKNIHNKNTSTISQQYQLFKNNLSAYVDNELPNEENIKLKKFAINNSQARQDLEDTYNIRKLLNDSFRKIKLDSRHDFSRSVMRQLELEEEATCGLHPVIRLILAFMIVVFVFTTFVIMSLSV